MKNFYVIIYDPNRKAFMPYDIIPYLEECYYEEKNRPGTLEEFQTFIKRHSMYQWWSRCEYEIILSNWPNQDCEKKIDVHSQVLMNLDVITEILMSCVNDC